MIELLNEDAYKYIKSIKDNSIDLVVIDPPYTLKTGGGSTDLGQRKYLNNLAQDKNINNGFDFSILDELERVQDKVNAYIFANKDLLLKLINYYNAKPFNLDILVWHKTNPPPLTNNGYMSDLEYILFVREKGVKVKGDYHSLSKCFSSKVYKNHYKHPTVKPLNIIKKLILNSSNKGDTVLDFFAGTGTTAEVCYLTNRNFKGCELQEVYYNEAMDRMGNIQQELFSAT
jgi:DNA modification methylase